MTDGAVTRRGVPNRGSRHARVVRSARIARTAREEIADGAPPVPLGADRRSAAAVRPHRSREIAPYRVRSRVEGAVSSGSTTTRGRRAPCPRPVDVAACDPPSRDRLSAPARPHAPGAHATLEGSVTAPAALGQVAADRGMPESVQI